MSDPIITGATTNDEIARLIGHYVDLHVAPCANNLPYTCPYAKRILNGGFYGNNATTIAEKVSSTFKIASTHFQRAWREVKEHPSWISEKNRFQIFFGLGLVGFGLYEGYHCIKSALKREVSPSLQSGTFSAIFLLSGSYILYDSVVKVSLNYFCNE